MSTQFSGGQRTSSGRRFAQPHRSQNSLVRPGSKVTTVSLLINISPNYDRFSIAFTHREMLMAI